MDPAEVLAIELRQFEGQGLKTLVPVVFGQTQEATKKRGSTVSRRWDEKGLFEKLETVVGTSELAIAREIFQWMRKGGKGLVFGTGREHGSAYPIFRPQGVNINPVYLFN